MNHKSSLFDTHTHLNFQAFEDSVDQVIKDSEASGVEYLIVVGTDINSSKKAVEITTRHKNVYASIGIHPHHIFNYLNPSSVILSEMKNLDPSALLQDDLKKIEKLINHPKVVAVGETGIDRHVYKKTKYKKYKINDKLIDLQKKAFEMQIKLAIKYQKTLVIHSREAVLDLLEILKENWDKFLEERSVFHCCEPDQRLLDFAIKHRVFIGIDGDVTYVLPKAKGKVLAERGSYDKAKQEFVKKIPLDLLVLETDSPFLTPVGLKNPNIPANLNYICEFIAKILKMDKKELAKITFKNSKKLFNI